MTYTKHGWHIPGTPETNDCGLVFRCGGPGVCLPCSTEASQNKSALMTVLHGDGDELAEAKVALTGEGWSAPEVQNMIRVLHNAGLVIRKAPYRL